MKELDAERQRQIQKRLQEERGQTIYLQEERVSVCGATKFPNSEPNNLEQSWEKGWESDRMTSSRCAWGLFFTEFVAFCCRERSGVEGWNWTNKQAEKRTEKGWERAEEKGIRSQDGQDETGEREWWPRRNTWTWWAECFHSPSKVIHKKDTCQNHFHRLKANWIIYF